MPHYRYHSIIIQNLVRKTANKISNCNEDYLRDGKNFILYKLLVT